MFAQLGFLISELAELLDMELMLSTTPVMRKGNSGLKLRDLVVEVSRWVLSANDNPTVTINRSHEPSVLNSQRKEEAAPPDGKTA